MLMSASSNYALTIQERLFDGSHVTPGDPGQRHDRRPPRPGLGATPSSRRGRSARPASTTPSAAISTARPRSVARREPRALQRHVQQRPGARPGNARAVPRVPRGGRAQGLPLLPGSLRPERADRASIPTILPRYINDMIARMLAGVAPAGTAGVPEDRLPRPQGDGGTGPLRPAPGRRHPRRLGGHDPRRLPAAGTTPRSTARRSPCTAARSTTPRTNSRSSSSSG